MPFPTFAAGMVPTADDYAALQWRYVIQSIDDALASSTTFKDTELTFTAVANAEYKYGLEVAYGAAPAADIKFDWTVPASATINRYVLALSDTVGAGGSEVAADVEMRRPNPNTAIAAGSGASGNFHAYLESGRIVTAGTAGAVT